jgi:2-methylcitrate dehydratase PrpD
MLTNAFLARLVSVAVQSSDARLQQFARQRFLDYVGCALAGAAAAGHKVSDLLDDCQGPIPVIGTDRRADPFTAALANGISAHWVELDDGHRYGMVHPGAPVFSALLSACGAETCITPDFLRAVLIGYESAVLLARAVQPGLRERGFHATGVCGTVGAALAVASLEAPSEARLRSALDAAVTCASGILKVIRGQSQLKPLNSGQAALNGLAAARVARAGYSGPDDVLAGPDGFLHTFGGDEARALELFQSDELPQITGCYTKPYAACRHCHAPIEAALRLRAENKLMPADVESIEIRTHQIGARLHDHIHIEGETSAKMSIPYSVATAIATGRAGMAEFTYPHIEDPGILALTARCTTTVDPEMTALVPRQRPAEVRVRTRQARQLVVRVDLPKGEPENPITEPELIAKFLSLATHAGLPGDAARSLAHCILTGDAYRV